MPANASRQRTACAMHKARCLGNADGPSVRFCSFANIAAFQSFLSGQLGASFASGYIRRIGGVADHSLVGGAVGSIPGVIMVCLRP